jgi:hypothetical protein
MAKRKRRLPHGQLGKPIVLEIEDWRAIASAAQIELTPSVSLNAQLRATIYYWSPMTPKSPLAI